MEFTTNLLGRKVLIPAEDNNRGEIVGVFADEQYILRFVIVDWVGDILLLQPDEIIVVREDT